MTELDFSELKGIASAYLSEADLRDIESAFEMMCRAHEGQERISGEGYALHPLAVAVILAELQQDKATLSAGLLHDTLEDTSVSEVDLQSAFGEEVLRLVQGVTKLGKMYFGNSQEAQAENYRRLFVAMAEDIRVVVIKLADRLHNMRTLKSLRADKQRRISRETMDIFAPLAHRLGMGHMKWELEDLAFMYLLPEAFQDIKEKVATKREERESFIKRFMESVEGLLDEANIKGQVSGRPKHFYSIYRKLQRSGMSYDELYDLMGIRILCDSVDACYAILGMIHSRYKPLSGRFKDYVAVAKPNGYQSLHTTVLGPEGRAVEVQIRSYEMDQVAEFGVAAHWRYKEGASYKADFDWLDSILAMPKGDSAVFLENLKVDLFADEVFAFTPKGDLHALPRGATPVDLAYKIHSDVGDSCVGAKVNGHIASLDYQLVNGDQVEILRSKSAIPRLGWLDFVQTRHAKQKIKAFFRKQKQDDTREKGRLELIKALSAGGYKEKEVLGEDVIGDFLSQCSVQSVAELYLLVAYGDVSVASVLQFLDGRLSQKSSNSSMKDVDESLISGYRRDRRKRPDKWGLSVMGEANIEVNLAKCCHPLPGDDVGGFVTMGHGVTVHRLVCRNYEELKTKHAERLVPVQWTGLGQGAAYPVTLHIEVMDSPGLLSQVLNAVTQEGVTIAEIHSRVMDDDRVDLQLQLLLSDHFQLEAIVSTLKSLPDVLAVYRPR